MMIYLLYLTACQTIKGYFIPKGLVITFIIHLYYHFLHSCVLRVFCTQLYDIKYSYLVSWLTVVKGYPKALFSIASSLRCKVGALLFSLDCFTYAWFIPYNTEYLTKRHQVPFLCLWYDSTRDWTPVFWNIGKHLNHYANW